MIEKVKIAQLPFTLEEGEVLYIEHSRHPRQQRYVERHYDQLLRIFSRRDLTFCYLPLHAANTLRYHAPYLKEVEVTELVSHLPTLSSYIPTAGGYPLLVFSVAPANEGDAPTLYQVAVKKEKWLDPYRATFTDLSEEIGDFIKTEQAKREKHAADERDSRSAHSIETSPGSEGRGAEDTDSEVRFMVVDSPSTDTETSIDEESQLLIEEIRHRVEALRQRGVDTMILHELIDQGEHLSRLVVSEDHRILLPDYNNLEIKMADLPKAVFLLFLRHPEGIRFKELSDHYTELLSLYRSLQPIGSSEKQARSVSELTNPCSNSINEKCARIREAFVSRFDDRLARHYYITGQRGEPKRITLDKNMIVWNIRNLAVSFLLAFTLGVSAQNPIVGPGQYFADPSAHQWERGGRLYVYGSRDESADHYCSHHYDIWSTRDLKTWTLHPDIFASRGAGDEVSYNDELLYAPDCLRMGDRYHLFYCQDGRNGAEGVAESGSPSGPFHSGSRLLHADEIDPSVFQDDDGTIYLFWGQFSAKRARMAPDLKSIDESSLLDSVITERDHHFHEGIQALKHNGHYYLIYADISRRGMPTCIGYSMSDRLEGPYEYKGVIIDNFGCDPHVWNNHGSIVEKDGQWYVFYHRATNGSVCLRKACVEPIHFNTDGTISEVEMTTQGASEPLSPFAVMNAERACYLTGSVRVVQTGDHEECLGRITDRNTAAYKYFHFGRSPRRIEMRVVPRSGGHIDVLANNLSRPLLATLRVPSGDGTQSVTISADISTPISGVCPIYLRFHGEEGKELFDVEWFRFE